MLKKQLGLLCLMIILFGGEPLIARSHGDHHMPPPIKKLKKKLRLTEDQVQQITVYRKGLKDQNAPLKKQLKSYEERLKRLIEPTSPDYGQIESLMREKAEITIQAHLNKIRFKKKMASILNPSQKEKLDKMQSRHKRKWGRKKRKDSPNK